MKVGILTHPQYINYGGILQCFALSTYLKQLGHTPVVLRREPNRSSVIRRLVRWLFYKLGLKKQSSVAQDRTLNIFPFVDKYLNRTKPLNSNSMMKKVCIDYGLNAVLVGSDQVWRRDFAMHYGFNYFLDFVPDSVIKASYAASFGVNLWDYTPNENEILAKLLKGYKGVSVREDEAVQLCKEHLGIKAELLIDPTMLLDRTIYGKYSSPRLIKSKYVFVYWLGELSDIENDILIYKSLGYEVKVIVLRGNHVLESVEDWLSYIEHAEIVLTDSFHGCVFSLIFQKQFIAYCNKSGGYGRILSLFESMGISEKLQNPKMNVDYALVENHLETLRNTAKKYLNKVLQ